MIVGLAVVNAHPTWTCDWRVVITIIGWLFLVVGIARVVLPDIVLKLGSALYGSPTSLSLFSPRLSAERTGIQGRLEQYCR